MRSDSLILLIGLAASAQTTSSGPSFSCAHVTSRVNQLICASPALSALARELANVFTNMRGQPLDQQKLQGEEAAWLSSLMHACKDEACIQHRYEARINELREQSLQAANPAAYAETRPFPAPSAAWTQARSMIGTTCTYHQGLAGPVIPGFKRATRFLPVILPGGVTVVVEREGVHFAFLVSAPNGATGSQIRDVVVLPSSAVGDRFLQCSVSDPELSGFGVRNPQTHGLDAFWAVNPDTHKIERVAMGVLGITKSVKCQQPEGAE